MPNENGNGGNQMLLKAALGLLTTALIGLFVWVWSAQNTLTQLSLKFEIMAEKIVELKTDTDTDVRQDEQLKKHWTLHGWSRHAINGLEQGAGKPLSQWPNLNP